MRVDTKIEVGYKSKSNCVEFKPDNAIINYNVGKEKIHIWYDDGRRMLMIPVGELFKALEVEFANNDMEVYEDA